MPFEFDDTGYRVFGYHQPIEFYDDSRALQATIYLQRDNTLNIGGETISRTGGESAVGVHALDSETHTGTLANWQGPQFLLTDGTRDLTGDLAIDDGDGDSPSLNFIGGTNDDTVGVFLSDDATAGNSDFVVRLCATDSDSQFIIQDSSPATVAYIDADGNVSLNGDLAIAASGKGITHADGNASGYVLLADGTRYVPADAAANLPVAPVAQGDILIADATPEWSVLTIGSQYTHLEAGAATATWEANISLADDAYVGISGGGRLVFDSTPSPDQVEVTSANLHLSGNDLLIDTDGDSYLHASADDVVDLVLATASGEFAVNINSAEDFTFTANSFNVLTGSGVTMADETWIGFSAGGRLVFDNTPAPDQIEVTAADLYFATASHGIIHIDGNTSGYILQSDGTRYVPANPAGNLPITPAAQGDMLIADATPAWSLLTRGAAAGYALVSTATTATWDQTPAWTGLHSFAAGITFNGASGANNVTAPDNVAVAIELLDAGGIEYLRIVSTDAQPVILFNEAGADVDFHVEASGVADALQVQGSDGQITLGALGAGFVQSSAGGVLSSAAIIAGDLPAHTHSGAGQGGSLAVGTTDTDATAGSVFFAGVAGVIQQDNANLFWDDTNNEFGIGTALPGATVHADQSSASGAKPVLLLDQGDVSEQCIQFSSDGADRDVNLWTINVTGTPALTWDESEDSLEYSVTTAATAAEKVLFALEHESNGTVAAYFGLTQMFRMENAAGTLVDTAEITTAFTTATAGAENSLFRLAPFHGGSAIAYLALWTSNGIGVGAVSVIPGGDYDVTKILRYSGCVAEESGSGTNDPTGSIEPGSSDVIYTDGTDTLTLAVGALGAATISRTAGSDTFTVFLSLQWI